MHKDRFDEIYAQYSERIRAYFRKRVGDPEDANDLTADTFLNFYRAIERFDETRCGVATYLYVIAANRLKVYYRDRKAVLPLETVEDILPAGDTPEDAYIFEEQRADLLRCLQMLPARERSVLIDRFYLGKSAEEVGARLGLTAGNVRVIQKRALQKLEKMMRR